jgi:ribosomal protein S18 acetylase RimI-like enzyme
LSDIVIRELRPHEVPQVERLVQEMQDFERSIDPRLLAGQQMAAEYTRSLFERVATQCGVILVAAVESNVVGFAAVQGCVPPNDLDDCPDGFALVSDLSVTEPWRGKGVGRRLLAACEEHAKSCGAREIRIGVLVGNHAAQKLYESFGFSPYLEIRSKPLALSARVDDVAAEPSEGIDGTLTSE